MLCLEERKLNIIPLLCVLFCDVLFVWLFHLLLLLLLLFFFFGGGGWRGAHDGTCIFRYI